VSIGGIDFCEVTNEDVLETEEIGFWLEIREHWRNRLLRSDKGRRIGKECVFETEDGFLIGNLRALAK
jgi:hypothetical protein